MSRSTEIDPEWESDDSSSSECGDPSVRYRCAVDDCGATFRKQQSFDRHIFRHSGIKAYHCAVEGCDKSYTCKAHLRRHIQGSHESRGHTNEKVACPECDKSYLSQSSMKKHYKQAHTASSNKTHDCPHCDQKFTKKRQLRLHSFTHTNKCPECGEGFQNIKALQHHRAAEHNKAGPKKCSGCDESFANWTLLVAHRKATHASTFPCTHCDRVFYSKCKLKIHSVSHRDAPDSDIWLTCEHDDCDHRTQTKYQMVAHIRKKHADKRFKCSTCERCFATKQVLQRHQRNMHDPNKEVAASVKKGPSVERRVRKDQGKPKISAASKLSGVQADPEVEKILLASEGRKLQIQYSPITCAMDYSTSEESEASHKQGGNSYAF